MNTPVKTQSDMVSRIWSKPETQKAIKALRDAGLPVTKLNGGYECVMTKKDGSKDTVFKAMNGSNGYLVRYNKNLFL